MELLVVGAGAMGRWFARTVEARAAFADVDRDAAEEAADAVGGEAVALDGDERFDVVCIAVPMSAAAEAIEAHARRAREAIVDVTGEMATPLTAMREHAPDLERASLHPLFAPENAPGNVAVVVDEPGPTTAAIRSDLEAADNRLVETTAAEHDGAMGTVQAGAHAAILAYGVAAGDVPPGIETPVSRALDDLVEQVADGEPDVYAEIQGTFEGADEVADAARELADADRETFERLFREATPSRPADGEATGVRTPEGDDA